MIWYLIQSELIINRNDSRVSAQHFSKVPEVMESLTRSQYLKTLTNKNG